MQTAKKIEHVQSTPTNHKQHSARLQDILLTKNYHKKNNIVNAKDTNVSIDTRLQAEMELEQALIKMFGYQ